MALLNLNAETLKHLDRGIASAALDRPGDDRPRKITLQLCIKPVTETMNNTLSCEGAKGEYKVALSIPDWQSQTLDFGVRQNGMLIFSEESPANHRQRTILDEEEAEK